jgi:IS605 OrfB family transposase
VATVARALVIPLEGSLPTALAPLLTTFRLLVNEIVRESLTTGSTSRGALSKFARHRAFTHQLTGTYGVVASGIALSLVKAHRTRVRRGGTCQPQYVHRPFLRVDDLSFHLDVAPQRVRLSLRNGVWTSFGIRLSPYHRSVLATPGIRHKQLHVTGDPVVVYYEKPAPEPYLPLSVLGLDTNERSLDGVCVTPTATRAVTVPFPEIAVLQQRHVDRRRKMAKKKSNDRRVARRLLGRERQREHHQVVSRLHLLTKRLVEVARAHHAALALENLSRLPQARLRRRGVSRHRPGAPRTAKLRRRLSSWPQAELHRQLEFKAAERGVQILWVDPFRTSVTCPRCGAYGGPRSRMGPTFDCPSCGWRLDRQLNAGTNVGRIALRETPELGGLKLDLDALAKDAMRPHYPFQGLGRAKAERTAREGRRSAGRQVRLPSN